MEVENNSLLESLATCHDSNTKLVMYFMVNTALFNYLDQILNLTETLEFPILKNKTTFEQTLPISLNISKFDSDLLTKTRKLKVLIHQYNCKKGIFDLTERHDNINKNLPNKGFFSNNFIVNVFLFHCCNNLIFGHNIGNILIVQTQETQNISHQSCFKTSKRSRYSNNTGRCHHDMYLKNSVLYKFGIKYSNS